MIHGFYCKTHTFPTKCRFCGSDVFFFSCDCGSKVFFDELGSPWPVHNCIATGNTTDTRPSSQPSIDRVNIYRGSSNSSNLLPGLVHAPQSITPSVTRRLHDSRNQNREIIRIEPLGSQPVEAIGVVQDRLTPNLARRLGLEQGTVGYALLEKRTGNTDLEQITVLVDELASDPAAIDFSSYTFLCAHRKLTSRINKGAIISVSLEKVELLDITPFWHAINIELIA